MFKNIIVIICKPMFQMNAGKFQFAVSKETTKTLDVNVPTPVREIYVYKMKENYGMSHPVLVDVDTQIQNAQQE